MNTSSDVRPMGVASNVPFEILVQIFKHIQNCSGSAGYRRVHPTIKASSLVCSSWRYPAQYELFSHLSIGLNNTTRRGQLFASITAHSDHSHIPTYVKHLVLQADGVDHATQFSPDLVLFLQTLQHLRVVTFQFGNYSALLQQANFINAGFRDVLFVLLRLPTLSSIRVYNSRDFPIALISHCPNLTSLALKWDRWLGCSSATSAVAALNCNTRYDLGVINSDDSDHHSSNPSNPPSATIRLDNLHVRATSCDILQLTKFIKSPRSRISASNLTTLELGITDCITADAGSIFALCSSVENLTIDFSETNVRNSSKQSIRLRDTDIHHLKNLRTFKASGYNSEGRFTFFTSLMSEWILPLLASIPDPINLVSIVISMKGLLKLCSCCSAQPSDISEFMQTTWVDLKTVVRSRFTHLENFYFRAPWMSLEDASGCSFGQDNAKGGYRCGERRVRA